MLLIKCPWCGTRAETEFSYGGEAGIVRPPDPDALSDEEWADYLFFRANPRGAHRELWNHAQGCRRWFGVERDTVTYRIERSYILNGAAADPGSGCGSGSGTGTATEASAESGTVFSGGNGG
ncbi:MAG: sarcosine oxidase subunit delta [Proteobacteria bacterium]|nr:sarcosine oxidase subunit delta [Pseudomonadota bacterium]MYJ94386.1 sarcosine oxidase subunit delta [Pseudomonadota bacterium]